MPMSTDFENRLYPQLDAIAAHYGTPFHIYDEAGIRETGKNLNDGFAEIPGFKEFFAVKALPNPKILEIMLSMGFGFDCSSNAELVLSRRIGAAPEDIMFTSNNTSLTEFKTAEANGGCILNLDDISLIEKVPRMPELICFRYNPGPKRTGNFIIGNPIEAKYGLTHDQIFEAYRLAAARGAKKFGLHTMVASNELNHEYMVDTVQMLLTLIEEITAKLDIRFDFINMGGGLGIPYRPEDAPLNLNDMAAAITDLFQRFSKKNAYMPKLYMESGRFITGPHGALVVRAINRKEIYRNYIGVDASMQALMRPGMYDAYHHITVPARMDMPDAGPVDVVGSLCENNDKFGIQRNLPRVDEGDILVIHDTGAHGHSMGFNYNGQLRPKELLLGLDGTVQLIRRAETLDDYFATLNFESDTLPSA